MEKFSFEASELRKAQFAFVNEHFLNKLNDEDGLFGQAPKSQCQY